MRERKLIFLISVLLALPLCMVAAEENMEDLPGDVEEIITYWSFDDVNGNRVLNGVEGQDLVLGTIPDMGSSGPVIDEGISDNGIHFDGKDDLAVAEEFQFPGSEFTLSFWIMSSTTEERGVPISYATVYEENEFIVEDPTDIKIHIRGISKDTGISVNDGIWHHLAITWEFLTGELAVYKDMKEEFRGTLSLGTEIRSGGTLVLGNEQDELGGGFDVKQSFNGTLDEFLFFDRVFDVDDMEDLFETVLEPPKLVERTPIGGTHPVTTSIDLTFNVEMDRMSFPDAFSIEPSVKGTFLWDDLNVSFIPDEDLEGDTEYRVSIAPDAKDIHGRELSREVEFEFRTEEVLDQDTDTDDDEDTDSDRDGDTGNDDDDGNGDEGNRDGTMAFIVIGIVLAVMILLILLFAFLSRNNEE